MASSSLLWRVWKSFQGEILQVFVEPDGPVARGRDLVALEVQEFIGRDVLGQDEAVAIGLEHRGEHDAVEHDVVFADEMDHPRVFALPPFLPAVGQQLDGIGDIADRGVEPDVKDLAFCAFHRHGHAPVEVAAHGTGLETAVEPALALAIDVALPLFVAFEDPLAEPGLILVQRQVPVLGHLLDRLGTADLGVRIDEFVGAQRGAAFLALVAIGAFVAALGAGSDDIAVGQEDLGLGIVELLRLLLDEFAFIVEFAEEFRGVAMVRDRRGAGVDVEGNAEIGERLLDEVVVFVDDILRGASLLAGRHGDGHAVFVGSADKERFAPAHAQVADIDVGGNIDAGQMADVDGAVGIRQRASDEIPFFHNRFNSLDNLFLTVLSICSLRTSCRRAASSPDFWASLTALAVALQASSVMRFL